MKTITNEQLNLFVMAGKHYVTIAPKSKLWFAVDKILKVALKKLKKVDEEKNEKRREFAALMDKGVYDTKDDGTFKYGPEGHKKLIAALNAIDEQTVEINTHIIEDYDEDAVVMIKDNPIKLLSFDIRNAFEGIVIPEIDYESFNFDEVGGKKLIPAGEEELTNHKTTTV